MEGWSEPTARFGWYRSHELVGTPRFTGCLCRRHPVRIESLCHGNYLGPDGVCAMQGSKWDFDTTTDDDSQHALWPKSREEFADQFGFRSALLVFCIALFIAAIWFASNPNFEKCSAVENITDRSACYEGLRQELLKPPAKGADIPSG
jgi:hypothetical protein